MLDQELLAKAEANDVQAIFEVAKAYYIGDGVEENNDKAFELFSKVVALDPNFPDVYSRIGASSDTELFKNNRSTIRFQGHRIAICLYRTPMGSCV